MRNAAKRGDKDTSCTVGCCTYLVDTISTVPGKNVYFNKQPAIVSGDVIDPATPFTWNCSPTPPNCPPLQRKIIASGSKVYVNKRPVACVGDKTHPLRTITGPGHTNILIG